MPLCWIKDCNARMVDDEKNKLCLFSIFNDAQRAEYFHFLKKQ